MTINPTRPSGGVQSVERTFVLLELLADAGGSGTLTQLAADSGLPLATIHRLMRTLAAHGYVSHESSRRYTLGPRLVRLGDVAGRVYGEWAMGSLRTLAQQTGETANLAMLDGDSVVYVAQAPSAHSMRMFTEPGRRVMAHCTGVGKALLAQLEDREARALLGRTGMPAKTEHTITDVEAMIAHLHAIRAGGYALDDNEQEMGVRCVAVEVPRAPGRVAVSISGPPARITDARIPRIVPVLHEVAEALSSGLQE